MSEYKYASTQFNITDIDLITELNEYSHKHINDSQLSDSGREWEYHITVLYGLTSDENIIPKLKESGLLKAITITLGKVTKFSNENDVLKIDIISDELEELHNYIKDNFDNEDKWDEYNPHLTIAYVKKGECDDLVGDTQFEGREVKLELFKFSPTEKNDIRYTKISKKLQLIDSTELKNVLNLLNSLNYHKYDYLIDESGLQFKDEEDLKDVKRLLDAHKINYLVKTSNISSEIDVEYWDFDGRQSYLFKLKENGEEVGYLQTETYDENRQGIFDIEVTPENRRKGYATKLFYHAKEYLKNNGIDLVHSNNLSNDGRSWKQSLGAMYLPFNDIITFRDYLMNFLSDKTIDVNINELRTLFDFRQIVDWLQKNAKKETIQVIKENFNPFTLKVLNSIRKYSADIETSKRYYESRYNNLPETEKDNITNNFDEIINLDPTQNKKYLKWISNLILSNKVLKSDYYKIPELLQKFDKLVLKKQIPVPDNQITRYKSIPELYQKLQEYEEVDIRSPKELKEDIYQNTLFFEGNKFNIYIPTSYEESCKLGSGTNWCTATGNTRKHYDYYSKQGNLYIFINKSNPKEKYQLQKEVKEFKDPNDKEIENINMFRDDKVIMEWLKNNLDNNLKLRYNFSWKEMGYPEIWKGDLDLFNNKTLTDLGQLKEIKGSAYFYNSNIEDLKNLTSIGGSAYFSNSQIKSLGNLTSIGGNANFSNSQIKSLGNLTSIGGSANFYSSNIEDLGNLTNIGGYADFRYSQIKSLGNLQTIGGWANFENSQIKNLGKLTSIGGWADFYNSNIEDLGQLTRIGGNAYFYNSNIEDLGNLKEIKGDVYFENSQIKNLGKLTSIGGNAHFEDSQITNLGNLTNIGGRIYWGNRTDLKEQWEKRQIKTMKKTADSSIDRSATVSAYLDKYDIMDDETVMQTLQSNKSNEEKFSIIKSRVKKLLEEIEDDDFEVNTLHDLNRIYIDDSDINSIIEQYESDEEMDILSSKEKFEIKELSIDGKKRNIRFIPSVDSVEEHFHNGGDIVIRLPQKNVYINENKISEFFNTDDFNLFQVIKNGYPDVKEIKVLSNKTTKTIKTINHLGQMEILEMEPEFQEAMVYDESEDTYIEEIQKKTINPEQSKDVIKDQLLQCIIECNENNLTYEAIFQTASETGLVGSMEKYDLIGMLNDCAIEFGLPRIGWDEYFPEDDLIESLDLSGNSGQVEYDKNEDFDLESFTARFDNKPEDLFVIDRVLEERLRHFVNIDSLIDQSIEVLNNKMRKVKNHLVKKYRLGDIKIGDIDGSGRIVTGSISYNLRIKSSLEKDLEKDIEIRIPVRSMNVLTPNEFYYKNQPYPLETWYITDILER